MRLATRFLALVATVLAAACQPTLQELRADLDKGVGGYTGTVTPFTVPHLLRYEPSPDVTTTASMAATGGYQVSMRVRTRISAIGDQRLWDFAIEETRDTNGRVTQSINPPLVAARMLSSPTGPIQEADLNFPAFRGASETPKPPLPR